MNKTNTKPDWFEITNKLPKGYKWSDGTKYSYKAGHYHSGESYVLKIINNDLYIKGVYRNACFYGHDGNNKLKLYKVPKEICNQVVMIKNWQSMNIHDILPYLYEGSSPFFQNCLMKFWKQNGGKVGLMVPVLREAK